MRGYHDTGYSCSLYPFLSSNDLHDPEPKVCMAMRAFLDNPNFFYPLRWGFICFREGINNKKMKRVNIFVEIQSQIEGLDSALTKGPERVGKNVG